MIRKSPAEEKNAFIHPTEKFEKVFSRKELLELYGGLDIAVEGRIPKTGIVFIKR